MTLRDEALEEVAADETRRAWRQASEQPSTDLERKQSVFVDLAQQMLDRAFGPREWRVVHYEPGIAGVGAHDRSREYAVLVEDEDEQGELPLFVCWNAYRYADRRDEGHIEAHMAEMLDPSDGGLPWVPGPKVESVRHLGRELMLKEAQDLVDSSFEYRAQAAHDIISVSRKIVESGSDDGVLVPELADAVGRYDTAMGAVTSD